MIVFQLVEIKTFYFGRFNFINSQVFVQIANLGGGFTDQLIVWLTEQKNTYKSCMDDFQGVSSGVINDFIDQVAFQQSLTELI